MYTTYISLCQVFKVRVGKRVSSLLISPATMSPKPLARLDPKSPLLISDLGPIHLVQHRGHIALLSLQRVWMALDTITLRDKDSKIKEKFNNQAYNA